MRIAILGTRGIPANYGGFETFAEHLSTRLVARGHQVTVYCRAHYTSPRQIEFQGVQLKVLPTIRHNYSATSVPAFLPRLSPVPTLSVAALISTAPTRPSPPSRQLTGKRVALTGNVLKKKAKR